MTEPPANGRTTGVRTGERLLAELRAEIGRADAKAAVLVAAMGVSSAAWAGAASVAGALTPGDLNLAGTLLWWAGAAAWAMALVCLLAAVTPRYGRPDWAPGDALAYFHDIRAAADAGAGALREALRHTEDEPMEGLITALVDNSRIAAAKHRWMRLALAGIAGALILTSAGLLTA